MPMLNAKVTAASALTLVTAIVAAMYWFKSAAVPTPQCKEPVASISDAPEQHIESAVANGGISHRALAESARLNKLAALWTGISALLGAITTLLGSAT